MTIIYINHTFLCVKRCGICVVKLIMTAVLVLSDGSYFYRHSCSKMSVRLILLIGGNRQGCGNVGHSKPCYIGGQDNEISCNTKSSINETLSLGYS